MRRGGGKGHEKPKNCQHYHVQNESEGNWGHAAVKANSNRLRPWHEAAWSSNEQEEQSQSHNFILCWYSTRKMITENIYCPPNKIKLNNKATHVIYYNVCLLHKQQCLLPGSLLPAEVFSLRLAVSQRGGSGKPWISVWERIRCCRMVFLHGLHWAQAYPTWTDTLNKPWSIVLLLPFAHSSCTALIPCETQVYNWHKELIPKSVSNWSDHLVCPLAVPKGLMSRGPSA